MGNKPKIRFPRGLKCVRENPAVPDGLESPSNFTARLHHHRNTDRSSHPHSSGSEESPFPTSPAASERVPRVAPARGTNMLSSNETTSTRSQTRGHPKERGLPTATTVSSSWRPAG